MNTRARLLIAGIGNIFWGDDGFGVEVVRRLSMRSLPESVKIVDFGIRGLDLAYAMLDPYEAVILVDATRRGGEPGTLYVIEPELDEREDSEVQSVTMDSHGMVPEMVLRWVRATIGRLPRVRLVGCEPATHALDDDMKLELSEPVKSVLDEAVALVEETVNQLLGENTKSFT